jgi:hypothetical protein
VKRHKGQGFGRFLVKYALKCACEIAEMSSCVAVMVDPKDDQLKKYYMKYGGFGELPESPLRLYIAIKTAKRLLIGSSS